MNNTESSRVEITRHAVRSKRRTPCLEGAVGSPRNRSGASTYRSWTGEECLTGLSTFMSGVRATCRNHFTGDNRWHLSSDNIGVNKIIVVWYDGRKDGEGTKQNEMKNHAESVTKIQNGKQWAIVDLWQNMCYVSNMTSINNNLFPRTLNNLFSKHVNILLKNKCKMYQCIGFYILLPMKVLRNCQCYYWCIDISIYTYMYIHVGYIQLRNTFTNIRLPSKFWMLSLMLWIYLKKIHMFRWNSQICLILFELDLFYVKYNTYIFNKLLQFRQLIIITQSSFSTTHLDLFLLSCLGDVMLHSSFIFRCMLYSWTNRRFKVIS